MQDCKDGSGLQFMMQFDLLTGGQEIKLAMHSYEIYPNEIENGDIAPLKLQRHYVTLKSGVFALRAFLF